MCLLIVKNIFLYVDIIKIIFSMLSGWETRLKRRNPTLSSNKFFFRKVDLLNLEVLNQHKNMPVVLPISPIKI